MSETDTIEVDREYLWALEVLAVDYLQNETDYDEYREAVGIVQDANLKNPRPKNTDTNN